jgi:hypothetical protein
MNTPNPAEKFRNFISSIAMLAPEEARKAKLLYIKDEMSQLRAACDSMRDFSKVMGCLAIVPIFWPILWLWRSGFRNQERLQREQIQNAIAVWGSDLGDDAATLREEFEAIPVYMPSK